MKDTKNKIISAGVKIAEDLGFHKISTKTISEQCGISTSLIYAYFVDINDLRQQVFESCIESLNYRVVCQGLLYDYIDARVIPKSVKRNMVKYFLGILDEKCY